MLTTALADDVEDTLAAEEACVALLEGLTTDLGDRSAAMPATASYQRRRVEEVRALLASEPTQAWQLARIAEAVSCSPFHLARQFRQLTGETLARYLLRLRLALALERLADGETGLADLAVEVGFAHHSHMTARFRSVFDLTPTAVRDVVARRDVREVSRIVTATAPAQP